MKTSIRLQRAAERHTGASPALGDCVEPSSASSRPQLSGRERRSRDQALLWVQAKTEANAGC